MLTPKQRKHFRAIGHTLKPVVTIAANGLSEAVRLEMERALTDHELIKVKVVGNRDDRREIIGQITEAHRAEIVQAIGGMALVYRAAKKPNATLSNILRSDVL